MKIKQIKFKKIVRENKKLLIKGGISKYAVRSYLYTERVPNEENAKKISAILGMPLAEIPYFRTERNI